MTDSRTPTSETPILPPADAAPSPTPPQKPATTLSPEYRWLTVGMFALIFIAAFESLAVTTIMPVVARELDGQPLFALAFAVPLAAGIVGMVVAGNWADRSGPMRPLVAAGIVFLVGLVIVGFAPDMVALVLGRFVHGIGGAAVIVPLYVIVGRVYPPELRARVFAGFAAAWVIPSIVGTAIAGFVAESVGWRWVFLGVIFLVLPAGAMMAMPLRRARDAVAGDPNVPWSLGRLGWAVLAAVAALGVSLSKELDEPWRWIVAGAGVAVALVAVRPLLPPGTLRVRRGLPAAIFLRMLVAGAFFGSEVYLPYLFIEHYDFSPSLAGAVLTGAGLSWAFASWLQGRLGAKLSNTAAVRIGAAVMFAALVVVLAVAALGLPPAVGFAAWTIAGGGMGLMYPRFSVTVLELSPRSAQGFNSAALSIAESLGAAVAIAVTALAASVAIGDAFTAEFAVTVVIAAVAVVLAPRMRPAAA